LTYT